MAISSVNMMMGASYGAYNQKLTESTKRQLEKLNIPYDSSMSESQGKALIQKYEASKSQEEQNGSLFNQNSSKNFLYEKALELAKKLGIQIPEQTAFSVLLSLIETEIEKRVNANSTNEVELKKLKSYAQELASLQAQTNGSTGFDNTNKALEMSLEMLSLYNRYNQYNQNYSNK